MSGVVIKLVVFRFFKEGHMPCRSERRAEKSIFRPLVVGKARERMHRFDVRCDQVETPHGGFSPVTGDVDCQTNERGIQETVRHE